ncbi:MAG: Alkylglycerol monooxygenase [Bacteroidota bacterium]|jgi:sterol desaturase/sphingolipid hydroxylase (fatty acid hydroxylase superfamily)
MLEAIKTYFETIPSLHRALLLAGGISFFWMVEFAAPLFNFKYSKVKHAGLNLFFTFTTIVINFAFALLMVKASDWTIQENFGLLHVVNLAPWVEAIAGLLLLDFIGAYLVHMIEHKVKFLWKFHMVHHADTMVDTTTGNRHHPGESVVRAVFAILAVFILGTPMWMVMLYQSLSVVLTQFNHANIRIPTWFDKSFGYIIVSPNMHRVHHHITRPQTDSNYGNIFSFWDRLLGTYNDTPMDQIVYGLDVLDNTKDGSLAYQLKAPFDKTIKSDY